jgi:hypothetical protein
MPIGWILSLLKRREADKDHSGGAITATRLLGCPRQTLIEDFVAPIAEDRNFGLVFDPRRMNSAHFGTIIHKEIEEHTPGGYKEIRFPRPGTPPFELDFGEGVTCAPSGAIDYLHPDTVILEDYKTHSEAAHKFKWNRKAADPEVRAQFGIYKALVERGVEDAHVKKAIVWHGAMVSARHPAPPWFHIDVVPLSLQEIGDLRPFGSRHTVREVITMYKWALQQMSEITAERGTPSWYSAFDRIVSGLAMVGETMFGGQKCTSYCGPAQPYCFRLAGKAEVL